jgi:Tfp pilus assembly protein PilV
VPGSDRPGDERGLSLVEVLVASVLTLVILTMGYQILSSTQSTAATIGNRAENSTNARLAIDSLEANLRYADAVWVCVTAASGTACNSTLTTASATTLTVENASGDSEVVQPACAHWTLTSAGLVETTSSTTTVVTPGAAASTGTTGFSLPLTTLVEIDLSVNQETIRINSGDAVSIHDLIAPDNLGTLQTPTLSTTPCT